LNRVFDAHTRNGVRALNEWQETVEGPDISVARYRQMLYFVAEKMLGNYNDANDAVDRCLVSASTQIPAFECEGAFRSWLVRVLMDEASLILHKKRNERPDV
jgi:DNA-directed RNA polymerase specialized sigma24 family protein